MGCEGTDQRGIDATGDHTVCKYAIWFSHAAGSAD
jgi:hypothetical protein